MANRFEYLTRTAKTQAATWSYHDKVAFHYFNPNGLLAEKRVVDQLIDAAVEAGKCKSGAIIAYGGLNYYYTDMMRKLFDKKRVSRINFVIAKEGIVRDIEKAREFLAGLDK
jgi:hypothetical protein